MPLEVVLYALLPLLAVAVALGHHLADRPTVRVDFDHIWRAGRDTLHGRTPYPSPSSLLPLRGHPIGAFVYPAPVALLAAPFGLLSYAAAARVWGALNLVAIVAALLLVGVRDWRCYGVALLGLPMFAALVSGNLTPLLLLLAALLWRYRDRRWPAALAVAGLVLVKVFMWPLLVWLLFTGRRAAAVRAVVATVVLGAAGWAAIGFHGLRDYPALLVNLSRVEYDAGYSIAALVSALGGGRALASLGTLALTLTMLVWLAAARGRDREAFTIAIGLSVAASTVVWSHYFALLTLSLALLQPRLSLPWLLPFGYWAIGPAWYSDGALWRIAAAVAVSTLLLSYTSGVGRRPGGGGYTSAATGSGSRAESIRASATPPRTSRMKAATRSTPSAPSGSGSAKTVVPAITGSAFVRSVATPAVASAPPFWKPRWRTAVPPR
jgi:hypothetical protein